MPIKSILVPLFDGQGAQVALNTAFTVAKGLKAHVNAFHVKADATQSLADFMGEAVAPSVIEEVITAAEQRADSNAARVRKAFDAAVKGSGVVLVPKAPGPDKASASLEVESGRFDLRLEARGRVNDLIVIRRPRNDTEVSPRVAMEIALMGTGRPILVAPPRPPAKIGTSVAIAWNGSAEAARAVASAMPFLLRARRVTVISAIEDGTKDFNQDDLVQYLGWHGIRARKTTTRVGAAGVGKALLNGARRAGADLLVMGAFTHSRLREMILGGATQHILTSTHMPVLLAH